MRSNKHCGFPRRQHGAALLLLMLLVLTGISVLLVSNVNRNEWRRQQQQTTQTALDKAHAALLDYAVVQATLYPGRGARLPCPDLGAASGYAEGEAHASDCGATGVTVLGRLPWRTLGIAAPKDAAGECLWYAVSGDWKDATTAAAGLVNPDSNGALQLQQLELAMLIAGQQAASRPLALVFAAQRPVAGQQRTAARAGEHCSRNFDAADYLDADAIGGISNAWLSNTPDAVETFTVAGTATEFLNDRVTVISRTEVERRLITLPAYEADMRALGLALTRCVADYARHNAAGPVDQRLPWPAPVVLPDYRPDTAYNDVAGAGLAGRLADIVDTSNALTGNAIARVISDCDSSAVPEWNTRTQGLWRNWKDHFFYAVAENFTPDATVPGSCTDCLSVNGAGQYVAILLFANSRLSRLGQVRDAPPADTDTRGNVANYLENVNTANFPLSAGTANFMSQPADQTFNDLLFCIDSALAVAEC